MATDVVTVYAPSTVTVTVIEGAPPDCGDLQKQVDDLTAANAALQTKIDNAKVAAQKEKDADAANVAGQGVLDALA